MRGFGYNRIIWLEEFQLGRDWVDCIVTGFRESCECDIVLLVSENTLSAPRGHCREGNDY